jgi:hypothetical protein
VGVAVLQLQSKDPRGALQSARRAAALLDAEDAPPGLVARATLAEVKAMWAAGHRKPAVERGRKVHAGLVARAPNDADVRALGAWQPD